MNLFVIECPPTKIESKETTDSVDITTCSPSKKRKKTDDVEESELAGSSKAFFLHKSLILF